MSDIPSFPYELLWGERQVRSVANLTRADAKEFLALAPQVPVRTEIEAYPLAEASEVLDRLRAGQIRGAAVLVVAHGARDAGRAGAGRRWGLTAWKRAFKIDTIFSPHTCPQRKY